jgi:hypothetical protein
MTFLQKRNAPLAVQNYQDKIMFRIGKRVLPDWRYSDSHKGRVFAKN